MFAWLTRLFGRKRTASHVEVHVHSPAGDRRFEVIDGGSKEVPAAHTAAATPVIRVESTAKPAPVKKKSGAKAPARKKTAQRKTTRKKKS